MIMSCCQLLFMFQNFTGSKSVTLQDNDTMDFYYMDLVNVHFINNEVYRIKVSSNHLLWTLLVRFSDDDTKYICVFEDPMYPSELIFHI